MSSNIFPLGSSSNPKKSAFNPEIQKRARLALKGYADISPRETDLIQEQLEESKRFDELAADIPGTNQFPKTGYEHEVEGTAVIAASKKAKYSIEKELAIHEEKEGGRAEKGQKRTIEKMKKLFPKE